MNHIKIKLLSLILLTIPLISEITYSDLDKDMKSTNYLYITKVEEVINMKTMTYFISDKKNHTKELKKIMNSFSELIGDSNGFIDIEKSISTNYSDFAKNMVCSKSTFSVSKDAIIFEDRLKAKCIIFNFNSTDYDNINNIFMLINENIYKFERLKQEALKIKIYNIVYNNFKDYSIYQNNKASITEIIDFIIDSIFKGKS